MSPAFEAAKNDVQIGYILKGYPRTSETFITNEIRLLEKMGVGLSIFSVKKLEGQKNHAMVKDIKAPVTYLPQADPLSEARFSRWVVDNVPKFSNSHALLFKKKPLAYLRAFFECLVMSVQYRNGFFDLPREVFFKEFLQAGYIANAVIESGHIQHLHAHFCHGSTTIAMFASKMSGIPFSFTAHAKDIYLKELNPGNLLQKKMRRAEFLVTCTGANEEHLQRLAPKGTKIHKIYHGLDTDLFASSVQDSPIASDVNVPVVLSVGRLVEKKGFDYLIKACAILKERGHSFHCQIVGGGDGYTETLVNLIKELGLEDTVRLLGAVTQEELREIYQQATLFALPCLVVDNGDRDGIPNVLVEAMSMCVPVISTDISGIPELIDNNDNGLLVPEKNALAMADAIERLLTDPGLRQQLGDAARARVCKDFDSQITTLDLKDLFVSRLANGSEVAHECCPSH
ncbi:glycosyltransferase family 4 protein [Methyloglobulus sp.]|uniref:glycosyltransferase family 4 protein n=1 Tax=Methyloglobulus sp. TaxID=2518622 RepID=UPI0032B70757